MKFFAKNALGCILGSAAIWGQAVSTSQINGTVRDSTGLGVAGAEIRVIQTASGLVRAVTSGASGTYVLPNLPTGPYELEVTKEGFSKYLQSGINLQVDSNPTIDVVMRIGSVNEEVTVQADAALVETHSTGVGSVVDSKRVVDLPLNGRNPTELIFLTGAATTGQANNLNSTQNYPTVVISVAGGSPFGLTYLLDGGTHNDPKNSLNLPLPFPDALQEFKVETSALPAQYGHHAAAAINGVTKSGTNAFHGDLFEFFRNGSLNARNFFAASRDTLKRNQFGGTVGGPIKHDKLFFFTGFQRTVTRSDPPNNFAFIPTASMLSGDFNAITSPACNSNRQITLGAPFVNNQLAPSSFNAAAIKLVSYLPKATDACGTVQYANRSNSNENLGLGRLDYQISDKNSFFGRYYVANLEQPTAFDGSNYLTLGQAGVSDLVQSVVLGDTYLLGPATVNSIRATMNRSAVARTQTPTISPSDLGVNTVAPLGKFLAVTVSGGFSVGSGTAVPSSFHSTTSQFADDLSLVRGAHQIGLGVNWIHYDFNTISNLQTQGSFNFSGQITGLGLTDFLTGNLNTYTQGNAAYVANRMNYFGLYLQDTWRLSSRLTMSLGARWEPWLPAQHRYGYITHFDPAAFAQGVRSSVYSNAPAGLQFPGDTGYPNRAGYFGKNSIVVPRVGLVWDPKGDGRQTIRASYGVFSDRPHLYFDYGAGAAPPWGASLTLNRPAGGFTNPWQGYPGGNPFPIQLTKDVTFPLAGNYINYPLNIQPPYMHNWNLSIQKQVGRDWLLTANYLGMSVIHLWTSTEQNPAVYLGASSTLANTNQRRVFSLQNAAQGQYYGTMALLDDGGTQSYNGLLLSAQRRFANSFTILGNYTWSHCIGDFFTTNTGVSSPNYMIPFNRRADRGNCWTQDRRHLFNLSAVAQTPVFSSRPLRIVASGWKISGIVRTQSGNYFSVTTGVDNALSATAGQRPNLVLSNPYSTSKNVNSWLNPDAFLAPAAGTYGNLGALNILGPGTFTLDMGMTRQFNVTEKQTLEFRGEAFNLPNNVRPNNPTSAMNSPTFGRILSSQDPRIIQLALKYVF